jgi:hypothetical protein
VQVSQSLGTPVPQLLAGIVRALRRSLRTGSPEQKQAALYEIATTYGVPLNGQGSRHALMGTIAQLRQELGQVKGYLSQQQQARTKASNRRSSARRANCKRQLPSSQRTSRISRRSSA